MVITVQHINNFTYICVGLILCCFVAAWIYILYCNRKGELKNRQRWIEFLPTAISSLGVLGTFAGITLDCGSSKKMNLKKASRFC